MGGHKFYLITNTVSNATVVYDIEQKLWYNWTDANGNYFPTGYRTLGPAAQEWHQDLYTGYIYICDTDYVYTTDYPYNYPVNTKPEIVPVDIYTPNYDARVDRLKYLSQMRFNADQTPGSKLYVRCSQDDYRTWSNPRSVDLSKRRPILNDCGSFHRRALHLRHYANTGFRISSTDLQMSLGTL